METFKTVRPPLFTTESAVTEAAHFLTIAGAPARRLLHWIESGDLKTPFQLSEQAGAVAALMDKYGGRMDLADATLVRLSELLGDSRVLTTDYKDFSIYRRRGRQVIPLLTPPA
ncbi:MAG: pilus assembly protein [Verrucomicrobiota bacterium]|nr:pilus assembly protein [Verrucomicrobiota bacterium]